MIFNSFSTLTTKLRIIDLDVRYSLVIMSIANMGAIIKKLKQNRNQSETRDQILLLKRMRDVINRTFDQAEKPISERRTYETGIKIAI